MKPEKLTDIVNNPDHPLMQEVQKNAASKPGDILKCCNCGNDYTRGDMDFYNLCDPCFVVYNNEKSKEMMEWLSNETKNNNEGN